jgi:hypothetical protein
MYIFGVYAWFDGIGAKRKQHKMMNNTGFKHAKCA